jgi:hypothetical protein
MDTANDEVVDGRVVVQDVAPPNPTNDDDEAQGGRYNGARPHVDSYTSFVAAGSNETTWQHAPEVVFGLVAAIPVPSFA